MRISKNKESDSPQLQKAVFLKLRNKSFLKLRIIMFFQVKKGIRFREAKGELDSLEFIIKTAPVPVVESPTPPLLELPEGGIPKGRIQCGIHNRKRRITLTRVFPRELGDPRVDVFSWNTGSESRLITWSDG